MIQPRAIVLCDDIREELGGKHTIVGMLGNQIEVETNPAAISLKLLTNIELSNSGADIEIEVTFNTTNIHRASVPAGYSNFNGILPLKIFLIDEKPLIVRLREAGGKWFGPWKWEFKFNEKAVPLSEEHAKAIRDQVDAMPKEAVKMMKRQS